MVATQEVGIPGKGGHRESERVTSASLRLLEEIDFSKRWELLPCVGLFGMELRRRRVLPLMFDPIHRRKPMLHPTASLAFVEQLEQRRVLAGEVSAVLNEGVLSVVGDSSGNSIVVTRAIERVSDPASASVAGAPTGFEAAPTTTVEPGGTASSGLSGLSRSTFRHVVRVLGVRSDGSPTTVNGGRSATFAVEEVASLDVDLGEGNDAVAVLAMRLSGDLSLDTGAGNDYAALTGVGVGGSLAANLGAGNDLLALAGVSAVTSVLDGGDDRDALLVLRSDLGDVTVTNFEFRYPA
jgi:hypothetical protein